MAKFLKKFQNHTQYETYTASTVFITPNVSYCAQEDEVHYGQSVTPPTPTNFVAYTASTQLNVDLTAFTPAAISETYDTATHTGIISFNALVTAIGDSAFLNKGALTSIDIPSSVTSIGQAAFANCSGLTSIDIPTGITSINFATFSNCSSLTSIDIPSGVTSIGNSAFVQCSGLTSIVIPDSVTSIGVVAFAQCSSLTSINIPSGVTSIGDNAFTDCSGLTSIDIPDSVTSIGIGTFGDCTSLASCTIGSGVTSIGNNTFEDCTSLTSIAIPNGVTSIGNNAFTGCTSLTSIDIPSGVTSIGNLAFGNCTSFTSITCEATTPPTLGIEVFLNTNDCPIYVPCESIDDYKRDWSTYEGRIQCIEPTPIIYEITVTPSAGKVMKGEEVIFTANVNSSIPSASAVTWNFEDCHLVGTTGNSIAVVYNEDSTTDIMWVTATSVYDESVYDYGVVSIYRAIENLSIYVYEETHNLNEGTVVNCEMYVAPSEDMWAEECCVNSVEWFSSDSSIATVDDNGQVTIQKRPEGVCSVDITCKISDCYGEYVSDPITFTWDDESADPFEP